MTDPAAQKVHCVYSIALCFSVSHLASPAIGSADFACPSAKLLPPMVGFPVASPVTVWLDDDDSDEDERPLASLTWITSSPEFTSPNPRLAVRNTHVGTACPGAADQSGSRDVSVMDDVQMSDDEVEFVKIIPPVVDLLSPQKPRPPASPQMSSRSELPSMAPGTLPLQVNQQSKGPSPLRVKTEATRATTPNRVKAEVVTPKRAQRASRLRVKTEFTPKRVLRMHSAGIGATPGKRHPLHPLSPNRSCLRGFVQARACHMNLGDILIDFLLLHLAKRFLKAQNIPRLFSGVDLSRPYAMAAHHSWGFKEATPQLGHAKLGDGW
eukprot:Skav234655  [mRNA]  locus=scaffold1131:208398:212016:- [translate_table: standard]